MNNDKEFKENKDRDNSENTLVLIVVLSLIFTIFMLWLNDPSKKTEIEFDNIKQEISNIKIDNQLFLSTYEGEEDKHIIKFKNDKHVEVFCENLINNITSDYLDSYNTNTISDIKGQVHHFDSQIYDDTNISDKSKKAVQLAHEFALEVNEYVDIIEDETLDKTFTDKDLSETYRKGVLSVRIADELVEDKDKPY